MGKQTLEIFKVLNTEENANLIEEVNSYYVTQQKTPAVLRAKLGIATIAATHENLEKTAAKSNSNFHIMYVGFADGKVVSTFTHLYDAVSHEMYLYESFTHESKQGLGYGSAFYKQIITDIFTNPEVYDICASAMTDGGRKLLGKLGFMPNTLGYSYGGNAILYSPHYKLPYTMARLEEISKLAPDRDFTNSPNVDKYNLELEQVSQTEGYNETAELKTFKRSCADYLKHSAKKMLKHSKKEKTIEIVEKADGQFDLGNLVFTFTPNSSLSFESPVKNEIDHNLRMLQVAKKLQNKGRTK